MIEAVQFHGDYPEGVLPDWWHVACEKMTIFKGDDSDKLVVNTLEGPVLASPGDWIIRGVKGELYPCRPDIFEETYEKAE